MSAWTPLGSDPDALTKYIHTFGVSKDWAITDIVSLEPDVLEWTPKPVKSIIFLFFCSETYKKHQSEEEKRLAEKVQNFPKDLYFMRQFDNNTCGIVALIHSIANNKEITLGDDILKDFLEMSQGITPEERGKALESNKSIYERHQALVQEGQYMHNPDEEIHHFIAFVNKEGTLYELDGLKMFPVKHSDTTDETFLEDTARVCKEFMARDPQEFRYTLLALSAALN